MSSLSAMLETSRSSNQIVCYTFIKMATSDLVKQFKSTQQPWWRNLDPVRWPVTFLWICLIVKTTKWRLWDLLSATQLFVRFKSSPKPPEISGKISLKWLFWRMILKWFKKTSLLTLIVITSTNNASKMPEYTMLIISGVIGV